MPVARLPIPHQPTELTDAEFIHVQEHTVIADRIVSSIHQFEHSRPGVRRHHVRLDGRGYPDGLAGENIPLMARILAVVNSYDAMMSSRPYRGALPTSQIDQILSEGAGTRWDRTVVEAFMACREALYCMCQKGIGLTVALAVNQAIQRYDSKLSRRPDRRLNLDSSEGGGL